MMYDVVAVDMKTRVVRLIAENKSERNAEAIVSMAVARRGVHDEFFADVPAGRYKGGERYELTNVLE